MRSGSAAGKKDEARQQLQARVAVDKGVQAVRGWVQSFHLGEAYAEQALTLDKSNTELINLRDQVLAAKNRKEKLENALRRADSAQQSGDLEVAAKAVEEALALDADNTQVKTLHASISKELAERSKQKQLQGMLDEARRDISQRKFTAAFDVLKKAESIDASSPEVTALMNLAVSGRDQEARRKDLEKFTNEIEDALSRDDYPAAGARVDQALQRFANDPGLLKLKALTEKQRDAGERKKFVEEQMAAARKLLDSGKAAEAMAILEKASQKLPGEGRLRSLLAIVRDSAEQEKTEKIKADYIQKANDARRKKDFEGAVRILESAAAQIEGSAEIQELLLLAREEAVNFAQRKKVDAAAEEAQRLIAEEEFEQAVSVLEASMRQSPNEEIKVLLADAKQRVDEFGKKVEGAVARARRLMETRKFDEAVSFLEAQPKTFARKNEFTAALEKARTEQDQIKNVSAAIAKAREALVKSDFGSAQKIMEACKKTYGDTPEIKQALAEFETKRVAAAKTKLDKAIKDARTLLLARQYAAVMKELESVAPLVSAATPELQHQYETLKKDAGGGVARLQKEVDLGKTIVAGSQDSSQTIVSGSYEPSSAILPAARPSTTRGGAAAAARPALAPRPPKKSPVMPIVIGVLALAIAVVSYLAFNKSSGPAPGPSSYIEINAVPWGTVKTITPAKGSAINLNKETPLRVPVAPGDYTIVVTGPSGDEQSQKITVSNESPGSYTPVFEKIDVEKILQSN